MTIFKLNALVAAAVLATGVGVVHAAEVATSDTTKDATVDLFAAHSGVDALSSVEKSLSGAAWVYYRTGPLTGAGSTINGNAGWMWVRDCSSTSINSVMRSGKTVLACYR